MWILSGIAWILGIASIGYWEHFIFPPMLKWILFFSCVIWFVAIRNKLRIPKITQQNTWWYTEKILILCMVFCFAADYAQQHLKQRLDLRQLSIHSDEVVVYIDRINQLNTNGSQQVMQVWDAQHQQSVLWVANIYPDTDTQTKFKIGHYYRVQGQVRPAHGYAVDGAFDLEKWYLQQNWMANFRVKYSQEISPDEALALSSVHFIQQQSTIQTQAKTWIEQQRLKSRELLQTQSFIEKGLMLALLTGDQSLLSESVQQQFQQLGISHLLAISGPHVLIFAVLMSAMLHGIICKFCPHFYLRYPKPYLLSFPFLACVLLYCGFVGFEIPACRTLFTAVTLVVCLWMKWHVSSLNVLFISASLLLLFDPLSIWSAGFWLSYGACFILLRIYQTIARTPEIPERHIIDRVKNICAILWESQWKIFVALIPIALFFFQKISWLSPIANVLAVPVIGSVIVPLNIFATLIHYLLPPLATVLYQCADLGLQVLIYVLDGLSSFSPHALQWFGFTPWQIASLSIFIVILFLPKGVIPRTWAVLCAVPLFIDAKYNTDFELKILDVGQGQAVYIRENQQHFLIDTGGSYNEQQGHGIAEKVLFPFFAQHGVKHLSHVILTHLDQDHSGAFAQLAEEIQPKKVMSNEKPAFMPTGTQFEYCHAGQKWRVGKLSFEILSPTESDLGDIKGQKNEMSCVVYLTYQHPVGTRHILIMGDAGQMAEQRLMQVYPHLPVDLLVLGHHGSRFSSSNEFLMHYQPALALVSAGFANRYGHPSQEVQQRLKRLEIPMHDTITRGTMSFHLNDEGQWVEQDTRHLQQWLRR
ncbi:MAG: DNA internalization-related competence protein ComEC/Rec2 [Acinetobacter sp.]